MNKYYFELELANGGYFPVEVSAASIVKATQQVFKSLSSFVTDEIIGFSVTANKKKGRFIDIEI